MTNLRCLLGFHRWERRRNEDSQYLACRRCGKERDTLPPGTPRPGGAIGV